MSPLGQTILPILQRAFIYFGMSAGVGLLLSFCIILLIKSIWTNPKHKSQRGEIFDFLTRSITAFSIMAGLYFFAQTI